MQYRSVPAMNWKPSGWSNIISTITLLMWSDNFLFHKIIIKNGILTATCQASPIISSICLGVFFLLVCLFQTVSMQLLKCYFRSFLWRISTCHDKTLAITEEGREGENLSGIGLGIVSRWIQCGSSAPLGIDGRGKTFRELGPVRSSAPLA